MYICVAAPTWRRLLVSFVAFALSKALVKAGITIAAKMAIIAITTSNSVKVKARGTAGGELLAMMMMLGAHDIALRRGAKVKNEPAKQECLTTHFAFGVCRSCPTKSLFHLRLRKVRIPSSAQDPLRPVCLRTSLRRSPVFH